MLMLGQSGLTKKEVGATEVARSSGGLTKWFKENWVDIGSPKKGGGFNKCGRSKGSGRKYPKCVPASKAARMTKSQIKSAVSRKRAAGNTGPKPKNVKTFAKRK